MRWSPSLLLSLQEFIHAAANGTLTLDTTGRVLSDYKIRRGRTEFNTKCSYDAALALENLLASADTFGVDPHRISTTGTAMFALATRPLPCHVHSSPLRFTAKRAGVQRAAMAQGAAEVWARVLNHAHAVLHGGTMHTRAGGSAGGGEIHYLTWVYHALSRDGVPNAK